VPSRPSNISDRAPRNYDPGAIGRVFAQIKNSISRLNGNFISFETETKRRLGITERQSAVVGSDVEGLLSDSSPLFNEYQLEWGSRGSNGQNIELTYELTNGGDRVDYEVTDHPFKRDWTAATGYNEHDIVYANAILYTCHDDHTSSAAGSGSGKDEPDTGDDWADFWTRGVGDLTAPSGSGTTISGASNTNLTLAGAGSAVHIGEYRTVWLRTSDGTKNGTWFRRVVENKGEGLQSTVTFTDPTTAAGDKVNVQVMASFKNLVGDYKIEYKVTENTTSPPTSPTITSAVTSGTATTIADQTTSSYNSTTGVFTERYFHYRILGGENMPVSEWSFVSMSIGRSIAVGKSWARNGSSPYTDVITITLDEISAGWSVSLVKESGGGSTVLNGSQDVSNGDFQSSTEDWDFVFSTKTFTTTTDATYRVKLYTDQYRLVHSSTVVTSTA
jgi:hypothetical protein